MAYSLIIHIQNSDPVLGEVDVLPTPVDTMVILKNPRKTDGKDLSYLAENVITVCWPVERLNFIEVVSTEQEEDILSFVRE